MTRDAFDKYVERHTRRTDALARQVDLIGKGYRVTVEWEARKQVWRLVYWREVEREPA